MSASTQNLAFTSLFFLFKHILGREFGAIDGVVRAKKTAYISVILSKAEIDKIFNAIDEPYLLIVDVRTTMIYTHTVKSTTKKEAKSPLDF